MLGYVAQNARRNARPAFFWTFRNARIRNARIRAFSTSEMSDINVLHEDEHILAVFKPRGVPVHGGAKVGARDSLIARLNSSSASAPLHLVHRLDEPTTGVLVLAKSRDVARLLEKAFAEALVKKTYVAAVVPETARGGARWPGEGTIRAPVAGKTATTHFSTLPEWYGGACRLLELTPVTGRTHQLRIHCATSLGAPILGDRKYGRTRVGAQQELLEKVGGSRAKYRKAPPLFLHCSMVKVPLIRETPRRITLELSMFTRVVAPLPDHFVTLKSMMQGDERIS
jgi:23S rRNA pseudouridine955/2504/2580 synthase